MADVQLIHRPAIGAAFQGSDAFAMKAMPEGTLIQILGRPGGDDLTAMLADLFDGDAHAIRSAGPGQWLVVRDEPTAHADLQALLERLVPYAFGVDQSHGRVRIAVSGHAVTSVLAKGTAVDFEGMAAGQSAMTLIGHISVHMTRCAADRFELIVLRGFAESLWDDVTHMGSEFV